MLVLSRKHNETIVIADAIFITVTEIRGDKVRLGIQCPRDVPVHRLEVWKEIQERENARDQHPHEDTAGGG